MADKCDIVNGSSENSAMHLDPDEACGSDEEAQIDEVYAEG